MVPGVDVRWSDYAGRYGIVCTPGTVIKGGDGILYLCQWKSAHDQASTDGSTRHLCREYEGYPNAEFVAARRPEVYIFPRAAAVPVVVLPVGSRSERRSVAD